MLSTCTFVLVKSIRSVTVFACGVGQCGWVQPKKRMTQFLRYIYIYWCCTYPYGLMHLKYIYIYILSRAEKMSADPSGIQRNSGIEI